MNGPVTLSRDGDVAIATIDNPPVNALSHGVRAGLLAALQAIENDAGIRAAVIACAGRTFVAGADIAEFGKPRPAPLTRDIAAFLDTMTKPVVAALFGTVLGGGLELALGCHARIAAPGTSLGLPEVKLGLIPGGGGTQRLPRLAGAQMALRMIVTGEPVGAEAALGAGLIDAIAASDLLAEAGALARSLIGRPPRRVRDDDTTLAAGGADHAAIEALATDLLAQRTRLDAPRAAVEAVRAAITTPFAEGSAREADLFAKLEAGTQSAALRHLFFAERAAARAPRLAAGATIPSIERVAVVGAGTMGRGIAQALTEAGLTVTLIDADAAALQRAQAAIDTAFSDAVARGRLAPDAAAERSKRITGSVDLARAGDADLVIEAIVEDLDAKRALFARLAAIVRPQAILATNTSYLDIDAIAAAVSGPERVAGMHFFSPATLMRLVEIIRGRASAPETLAALAALAKRLRKAPVFAGNAHGFIGNRMLKRRSEAVERLLLAGALPQAIDAAMVAFGFPMGPLAAADLAGLDIGWAMRRANGLVAPVADALCGAGRFGQKTGRGYYLYAKGSRMPLPDPEVKALIGAASLRLGVAHRPIGDAEIVEALLLPVINEGARLLGEGVAARPGDIDVVWVNGYGWPAWRGGPMFHAEQAGLRHIRDRLAAMAATTGDPALVPAPLLERSADVAAWPSCG